MTTTYTDLVTDIQNTMENTFDATGETTNIDRIIQNAEQRIYNTVSLPATNKSDTTITTVMGTATITPPADFLAPSSLAIVSAGTYTYLLNKDQSFIREAYPTPATTGVPVHYAFDDDNTIRLGPTPDAAYQVVLWYFAYPESIVTASTTWLGDNFYFALLAACLVEAAVFMKMNEVEIKNYDEQFKRAMALLKNYGNGKVQQDDYRSGMPRTKVV